MEGWREMLERHAAGRRVIAVVDDVVDRLYGSEFPFEKILLHASEENKTLDTVAKVMDELLALRADRDTFLLGIGGGITTDLTGFVASVFKRGVDFAFIPTTLLAMVDASIGGKNGVNVRHLKNMVGTFNLPCFIHTDCRFLRSFSTRELYKSLPEMFKAFLISGNHLAESASFFAGNDVDSLFATEENIRQLQFYIQEAVRVKERIVAQDGKDRGIRKILNLGHTVGHAIECCTDEFSHGEAVGMGLVVAAQNGSCPDIQLLRDALSSCGLPVEIPSYLSETALREAMAQDKKIANGKIDYVVLYALGDVRLVRMPLDAIQL
ncbi:MAG: 3-dehydroquinate synthase [Bacteroidales bacterium]|nr:3-dehydroquinate synthase [Bacteroidales bacterium]